MDYYERALVNGIMGVQRGQQSGVMIYMLPLGSGMSKARSYHGWGNKFDSFWCCYGTGIAPLKSNLTSEDSLSCCLLSYGKALLVHVFKELETCKSRFQSN